MNKTKLTLSGVAAVVLAAYLGVDFQKNKNEQQVSIPFIDNQIILDQGHSSQQKQGTKIIAHAFENKLSNIQVEGIGKVKAILKDDNEGSRHQKFILQLENGQTLLVAHNIDLAPRINQLKKGDTVQFYGEYEYSAKGGVMHWTHHDPRKKHADGWLKHEGKTYQ